MNPERWREIERLYEAALELQPGQRESFVREACAGDESLRSEVEKLLRGHSRIDRFIEEPAMEVAAREVARDVKGSVGSDLADRQLLHYRVVEKIGEGGMGVVYRARDEHLKRDVAIKVLSPELVADPERKKRFVQEARAASALSHPNIVTIHDISQADGIDFISMEYIPGKTLGQKIGRKGMKYGEVLKHAIEIADALAAAHAAGIMHRDLKPANILISDAGRVKVLDFGLAKLTQPTIEEGSATASSTAIPTAEGRVMGTAAYMSPEQAEGKPVDARSDVFSFGSVLYEMLTGERAFRGETTASTIAAILREDPKAISQVTAGLPRELERIVKRCLRKDPDRRFHHMIDIKVALEELKEESESGALQTGLAPTRRRRWWPAAMWALGALAVGIVGVQVWRNRTKYPAQPAIGIRLTADSGFTTDPALSPDGKWIAYASDRAGLGNLDIWIQSLSGGETNRLTEDPADERGPSFSPDGSRIVFRSEKDGGGLYSIPAFGGEQRLVARGGHAPRYSPDGSQIAYHVGSAEAVGGLAAELGVVDASGGTPRRIATGLSAAWNPIWTPDGEHLLTLGQKSDRIDASMDWWVVPASGGEPVPTGAFELLRRAGFNLLADDAPVTAPGAWLEDSLVFSGQVGDSRNVWLLPVSHTTWKATGPPQRLTSGTSLESEPAVAVIPGAGSRLVRLVFASLLSTLNVYDLPIDANRGRVLANEPRRLTSSAYDAQSSLSADGRRLAFVSTRSGNRDIWLKDLESGKETALTLASVQEFAPEIWADGSKVGYQVIENDRWDFFIIPIGPDGKPGLRERICEGCLRVWDFSSDGKYFLFALQEGTAPWSIGLFDVESRRKSELIHARKGFLVRARFSPDDRWLSFHEVTGPGRSRVTVAPFREGSTPSPDQWIAVTGDETFHDKPVWSPDGNLLYYTSDLDGFRCIWAQRLDPVTRRPVGPPLEVYHSHSARRSILNANIIPLEINVAPGRLVFHMAEITGNIWMTELKGR